METGNAKNPAKKTRSNLCTETPLRCPTCFFCDKKGTLLTDSNEDKDSSILRKVTTLNRDKNIRLYAVKMGDSKVIAKLSEGDMISREACYHSSCMTEFSNSYISFSNENADTQKQRQKKLESMVLAEVMVYFVDPLQANDKEIASFIKLSDVRKH